MDLQPSADQIVMVHTDTVPVDQVAAAGELDATAATPTPAVADRSPRRSR